MKGNLFRSFSIKEVLSFIANTNEEDKNCPMEGPE